MVIQMFELLNFDALKKSNEYSYIVINQANIVSIKYELSFRDVSTQLSPMGESMLI